MKTKSSRRRSSNGFTLVEVLISMTVLTLVIGMAFSTFLFCMRMMYKDNQRLATNASLRSFMAQVSKETLDASYFYLFDSYTKLDGSVNLASDPATLSQSEDFAETDYDKWVAHGDCMVLVTMTVTADGSSKFRQIRIYYRRVKNSAERNADAPIRYYEIDWGVGGHPTSGVTLTTILNAIDLNTATTGANYSASAADYPGSRQLTLKSRGRTVPGPFPNGPYVSGDLYPAFSSESPSNSTTNGFISINVEFVNGTSVNNLLSSSSFNYTISPRR